MDLGALLERIDMAFEDERLGRDHRGRTYTAAVPALRPSHASVLGQIAHDPLSTKATACARHLATRLLAERGLIDGSTREWAWIWSELGLADLVSDRLAYGWRIASADGYQQQLRQDLLHVMRLDRKGNQKAKARCGRVRADHFSDQPVKPALRGAGESRHVCPACAHQARDEDRLALDERLDTIWLSDDERAGIAVQAVEHATSAIAGAGNAQDHFRLSPDPARAVAEAVSKALDEGVRRAWAERTLTEYDLLGDEALHTIIGEGEADRLRAWPHQSAVRLVDLLTVDDLVHTSLPHLRANPYHPRSRLDRHGFARPMRSSIAARVRQAATAEAERIEHATANAQAARERTARLDARAVERARVLAAYEDERERAHRPSTREGDLGDALHRPRHPRS